MDISTRVPFWDSSVSFQDYLAVKAYSSSDIKELSRSPRHYFYKAEKRKTDSAIFGSAAHAYLLEGEDVFNERYIERPEGMRQGTKEWHEWVKSEDLLDAQGNPKREILKAGTSKIVRRLTNQALLHPDLEFALQKGTPEISWFWRDPVTGLLCKARTDWLCERTRVIWDIKTFGANAGVTPGKFRAHAERMQYMIQAAHYFDGANIVAEACGEEPIRGFFIAAIEREWPHGVVVYDCAPVLDEARSEIRRLLDLAKRCEDSGHWPGYAVQTRDGEMKEGITPLHRPAWAEREKQRMGDVF